MNINRGILIGIVAGVIVSSALVFTSDFTAIDAQMGGGGGMSMGGDSGSSGGMSMGGGGGGPSRHGVFYGPGTVHQQCNMGGDMPPLYCEPYYKAMSSVVGIRVTNVDPVNEKTLRVTLKELNVESNGVNQKISVTAGSGDLVGAGIIDGGWTGSTTIDVPLKGMGHIYTHESMHVHIFPVTG